MAWKYKVDSKLRGAYGETDFDKKVIRINKKAHKSKKFKRLTPNKNGTENMAITIQHELVHKNHPNMREKAVEKLARAMVSKMGPKKKQKLYSKFK